MPVGTSGRIVIEIDPDLKQDLYSALEAEGLNLKQWFLAHVEGFLEHRGQMALPLDEGEPAAGSGSSHPVVEHLALSRSGR
jgi:hypothetical protein